MATITPLNELGLSAKNAGCNCGCGHDAAAAPSVAKSESSGVTTTIGVDGMTCSHCVSSVTEELGTIDGVASVDVELNAGGTSTVTVVSTSALDDTAVTAAIAEAGYQRA